MNMEMTSKERLLIAIKNKKPDRVPVMPDFSNMIPCKLTGKAFWEIYLNNNPRLYYAYAKAADYYGVDGWYQAFDAVELVKKDPPSVTSKIISKSDERIVRRIYYSTPAGDFSEEITYYSSNPPTHTGKMIKDIKDDFAKIKYLYGDIISYNPVRVDEYKKICGDKGIFCLVIGYPGMQAWNHYFEGNLQSAVYAYYDYPEIFDEWYYLMDKECCELARIYLSLKPDTLLLGGSGTLTLATPEIVRKYALPTIKKITRMAKEAGVPTMLHSCGNSMKFIEMLANETDLDCINPLEGPPMGDVDLKTVKKLYGNKLSLMGNLNTTEIMLLGTPEIVGEAAKKAIDDAGENGGFILSTGDQCGRDTPDENIFKLVEIAKTYGKY